MSVSTNLPTLRRLGALRILVALVLLALVAACGSSSSNVDVKVVQSTLQFVPGDLSFGDQTVNTPVTQAVTLVNNGTTPVTGISVEICDGAITNSANFPCAKSTAFAGTSSCPSQLDVAQSCAIQVTFQPTGVGSVNATLVATNANNLNGPPLP